MLTRFPKCVVCYARQVSFVLFSQFLLKWLSLKAARFLHNSMLRQLLRRACHPFISLCQISLRQHAPTLLR